MVVAWCGEQDRKKVHFLSPLFRQLVASKPSTPCVNLCSGASGWIGSPMKRKRIDTLVYSTVIELIEELVNRATFVGVVVASDKEHKRRDTVHDTFNTYASLNNQDQVVTILKTVATNIEEGQP